MLGTQTKGPKVQMSVPTMYIFKCFIISSELINRKKRKYFTAEVRINFVRNDAIVPNTFCFCCCCPPVAFPFIPVSLVSSTTVLPFIFMFSAKEKVT